MKKIVPICKHLFAPQTSFLIKRLWLPILFLILCGSAPAQSQEPVYITAPEVKDMVEKNPDVVLINVLSTIEYDGLHITGSINIPINVFHNSDLLPKKLDTPLIIYCMGKP